MPVISTGNSIFFQVKRIEDPIGLLPAKLLLGINKRGIHFFRPVHPLFSKQCPHLIKKWDVFESLSNIKARIESARIIEDVTHPEIHLL